MTTQLTAKQEQAVLAARRNDTETLQRLLADDEDLSFSEQLVLRSAVSSNSTDAIKLFLDEYNPSFETTSSLLLSLAIRNKANDSFYLLLEEGANLLSNAKSLLYYAALVNNQEILRDLMTAPEVRSSDPSAQFLTAWIQNQKFQQKDELQQIEELKAFLTETKTDISKNRDAGYTAMQCGNPLVSRFLVSYINLQSRNLPVSYAEESIHNETLFNTITLHHEVSLRDLNSCINTSLKPSTKKKRFVL